MLRPPETGFTWNPGYSTQCFINLCGCQKIIKGGRAVFIPCEQHRKAAEQTGKLKARRKGMAKLLVSVWGSNGIPVVNGVETGKVILFNDDGTYGYRRDLGDNGPSSEMWITASSVSCVLVGWGDDEE